MAQSAPTFTPEQFGARGDGRTNDTQAFAAMSRAIQQAGGGVIRLSRKTYLVGWQRRGVKGEYGFEPAPVIALSGLRSGVAIIGGGAVLRAAPGLRFGSFDAAGRALRPRMPFFDASTIATPYRAMIIVEHSRGPIAISDLELDGNIGAMVIGGEWGDVGRQLPMVGITLRDNLGDERVSNVHSHHHGLDGMLLDGPARNAPGVVRQFDNVRCTHNGRQGCSLVGGTGYRFSGCDFSHTGRAGVSSAPGAGFDIEAEGGKPVRDIAFADCTFADNSGAGMVADSGPSRDVRFTRCRFTGTTNWSVWPSKPGFRFDRCTFAGAVVRAFASEDPREATQFVDCVFTDHDGSAGGKLYGADGAVPMVDLGGSYQAGLNVAFVRCRFTFTRGGKLPWTVGSIYDSVTMEQASKAPAYPRGVYRGRNSIRGPVDLYSSRTEGTLLLNGRDVRM